MLFLALVDMDSGSAPDLLKSLQGSSEDFAYHLRYMANCGLLEFVGAEPSKGKPRRRYRIVDHARPLARALDEMRPMITGEVCDAA